MRYTSEPTPEQLLDLSQGAKLAALAEPLSADLGKLMEQSMNKVFIEIANGTLTPDLALQAWYELNAYQRLLQRFNQRIKVGQSISAQLHEGE